jgi:hypothetical protein
MKKSGFKFRFGLVLLIAAAMFALHNSFWLWPLDGRLPFLFGFMPFAFSYYVFYALLAVAAMALVIKLAWPDPPERLLEPAGEAEPAPSTGGSGRPPTGPPGLTL